MDVKMELQRESSCFPTLAMWIRVWVLLASVVDLSMGDLNAISEMVLPGICVRFKANSSSFKIAIFADLHYGENAWEAWGPQQDVKSTAVQSFLLDHHLPGDKANQVYWKRSDAIVNRVRCNRRDRVPNDSWVLDLNCLFADFVMYLGDVITANNLPYHDATLHWRQAVGPAVDREIPFASVFGNHDDATFEWDPRSGVGPDAPIETTSRTELMDFDARLPSSFSAAGPKTLWPSVSNFVIPIVSSDGTEAVAIMYFLDSGGGSMAEFISADQVAWFTTAASMINPGASIPELVFWHIPSIAYTQVGLEANQPIKAPCVGSINDESIAPQETERGIMNALASRNSVKAVFVGHNHGLDWCCPYHNFHLCFARHTGYGGYGTWKRGARFVEILQEPAYQIKTYVSLEDGTLVSDMLLN